MSMSIKDFDPILIGKYPLSIVATVVGGKTRVTIFHGFHRKMLDEVFPRALDRYEIEDMRDDAITKIKRERHWRRLEREINAANAAIDDVLIDESTTTKAKPYDQ